MNKKLAVIVFSIGLSVALLIAAVLIFLYLRSPNVVTERWGGPAEFGQFGDMIGGVLNPIFALVSAILLWFTYNQTIKNSKIENERVEREEIRNVINDTKHTLNSQKSKKSLMIELDKTGTKEQFMYFSLRDCFDEENNLKFIHYQQLKNIKSQFEKENPLDISGTPFEESNSSRLAFKNNYLEYKKIVVLTKQLIKLQLDYLKTQQSKSLSNLMSLDIHNVLEDSLKTNVISENEYKKYVDTVISMRLKKT